ncbi:MAG: DUF2752 domain-containing protein [Flavipsychrobacter sp.]|nr:DUF2752 domain-containing protein [Flavipsychrobacter sp.]
MYRHTVNLLERHMLQCPSKALLHVDCPGCGLQRSLIALLRGNLGQSWHIYPPGIFMVALLILLCLHLLFGFRHGAKVLIYFFAGTSFIVVINYIYKIITHQL